jgi:hypothetical protein
MAANKVTGSVIGADATTATPVEALTASLKPALASQNPLTAAQGFVRTLRQSYSGPSQPEALARAQATVDQAAAAALTARGTVDTLKYGDLLVPPGRVGVRGAGETFDGDYSVRSVLHRIARGQYTQEFTIVREGPGGLATRVNP